MLRATSMQSSAKRGRRRQQGFTLVEFAASVAVVAVALVGTAASIAAAAEMSRSTQQTRAASRGAATLMENIRATPFDRLVSDYDDTTHTVKGIEDSESGTGSARVTVVEEATGSTKWKVYRVTVNTTWKGVAGDQNMSVVTYVSDRREGGALSGAVTVESEQSVEGQQ